MRRAWWVAAAVAVAVPLAAVGAAQWFLRGEAVKARLVEQVRRQTGRELRIGGRVSLAWSLSPTLKLVDVSLSNPPGFSRPIMAHAAWLEAQVDLRGLLQHRIVVEHLTAAAPTVELERDASGRGNWVFSPPQAASAGPSAPAAPPREPYRLQIGTLTVRDATLGWGGQTALLASQLDYDGATGALSGQVVRSGQTVAVSGTAGPLDVAAYPVDLRLTGAGAVATLSGTAAAAELRVSVPDLAALSPLAGRALPPLRDVALSASLPGPHDIRLAIGAGAAGKLAWRDVALAAPSLDDPAALTGTLAVGAVPVAVAGTVSSLAALSRGAAPVALHVTGDGLDLRAAGSLAPDGTGAARLALSMPDLAAFGAGAGLRLPTARGLTGTAALQWRPGGLSLAGLAMTSEQGDLAGDLDLGLAGRPTLRGALTSTRLEIGFPPPPPSAPPPAAAAASPAPMAATPSAPPAPARAIPDLALPTARLREFDVDLDLQLASLRADGATLGSVHLHPVLQAGALRVDPASAAFGPTTAVGTLDIDAAATPPALHVTVDAPGLPVAAVVGTTDPGGEPGTLDVHADLAGRGDTVRAVAASLNGRFGIGLVDATVANAWLERLAAGPLRAAGVTLDVGGRTAVRCAALRADAAAGHVRLTALALDTSRLALDGTGASDLGTETLDLHLRPQLRIGGGLSVPIKVGGTFAAPKAALDPGALAAGRVGILLGGVPPPDRCGDALAAVRGVASSAAPPPTVPAAPGKPADLLRGLFR